MAKKTKNKLVFSWRYGEYGLEATPKRLTRFTADEENETIDFVRYFEYGKSTLKYSIGYFYYNENEQPCWELRFVGDRFKDIAEQDLPAIWEGLKSAYSVLTMWKEAQSEDL